MAMPAPAADSDPARPGKARWYRFLLAGGVIAAIAGFYATGLQEYFSWTYLRGQVDFFQKESREHAVFALLIFSIVYVTVTALSLPVATWLTLLGGALFGRWLGTAVVSVAATVGATIAMLTSRYLFEEWVERRLGTRLEPINRGLEKDGAFYLLTLRLVPIVPFFLINLGMGLTRIRVLPFSLVSWVGILPGTFLYANAGTELSQIESPRGILSPTVLVSLALLAIVPLAARKLLRK